VERREEKKRTSSVEHSLTPRCPWGEKRGGERRGKKKGGKRPRLDPFPTNNLVRGEEEKWFLSLEYPILPPRRCRAGGGKKKRREERKRSTNSSL